MDKFSIQIDDEELTRALNNLKNKVGNLKDVMERIGIDILAKSHGCFQDEQSPDGVPWQPLASSTIRQRAKRGNWPGPVLRVSGRLHDSVGYTADSNKVEIGSKYQTALIHQFGGVVQQPERMGVLAFNDKGKFLSKENASKRKKKPVRVKFATLGGHGIRIPARPYLLSKSGNIPDPWIQACLRIIEEELEKATKP